MALNRIAPELFRLIAPYLDVCDLERLYATFDATLQKILSFSGVFDLIRLSSCSTGLSWLRLYFLRSIRNIRRLEVLGQPTNPIKFILLLEALNPLEIYISNPFHHPSNPWIENLMQKYQNGTANKEERRLSRLWFPFQIPILTSLAPRLETLELGTCNLDTYDELPIGEALYLQSASDELKSQTPYPFPRTLTSLTVSETFCKLQSTSKSRSILLDLPTTLRTLRLHHFQHGAPLDLSSILPRLRHLEHFKVITRSKLAWRDSNTSFPKTLSSFECSLPDGEHAIKMLQLLDLRRSSLESVSICLTDHEAMDDSTVLFDFANLLPPTITNFALFYKAAMEIGEETTQMWRVTSLPTSLTSLNLQLRVPDHAPIREISGLTRLKSLTLGSFGCVCAVGDGETPAVAFQPYDDNSVEAEEDLLYIDTSKIPRSVTHFGISKYSDLRTSEAAIRELPPNLRNLTLPSFDFKMLPQLRKHSPLCFVTISWPLRVWSADNGQKLRDWTFGLPWTSTVDLTAWSDAVLQKRLIHALYFEPVFYWYETSVKRHIAPLVEHIKIDCRATSVRRLLEPRFSYIAVLEGLPNLKTLEMTLNSGSCWPFAELPPRLTHFKVYCPEIRVSLRDGDIFGSHLVHIATDTTFIDHGESWSFPSSLTYLDAPNWAICYYKLRACDLNAFEKLCLHITRIMDFEIPQLIENKNLTAKTRSIMYLSISYGFSGLLIPSRAMEIVTWSQIQTHAEQRLTKYLNSPLPSSFLKPPTSPLNSIIKSCSHSKGRSNYIYFPTTARIIQMAPGYEWEIAASPPSEGSSSTNLRSLKRLRRLELSEAFWPGPLCNLLPYKLRDLRISRDRTSPEMGEHLPPTLEVLVIVLRSPANPFDLTFSLAALPASLRHLCLLGAAISVCEADLRPESRQSALKLPKLESVFVGDPTLATALVLGSWLPNTIHTYEVYLHPRSKCWRKNASELGGVTEIDAETAVMSPPLAARMALDRSELDVALATHLSAMEDRLYEL